MTDRQRWLGSFWRNYLRILRHLNEQMGRDGGMRGVGDGAGFERRGVVGKWIGSLIADRNGDA